MRSLRNTPDELHSLPHRGSILLPYLAAALVLLLSACSTTENAGSVQGDGIEPVGAGEYAGTTSPELTTVYRSTLPEPGPAGTTEREGVGSTEPRNSPDGQLAITFLDVGQGSGILIRLPDGANVLIDGGPREGGEEVGSRT